MSQRKFESRYRKVGQRHEAGLNNRILILFLLLIFFSIANPTLYLVSSVTKKKMLRSLFFLHFIIMYFKHKD